MDFPELEVLISLAQEGSFSRAAEKLNRSQPAVSQALRRLEDELDTPLLDRSSRKVTLTAAGSALLGYALRMARLRQDAFHTLENLRHFKRGVLRLAVNESVGHYVLPPLLRAFRRAYQAIKIEVIHSPSSGIPALLMDQDVDFGFLSFAPVHKDLATRLLFRDELALALFPGHPLASHKVVDLEMLGKESFIAHLAQTPTRTHLIDYFARERVPLRIVMELSSLETIKDFVKAGEGIALIPRMSLRKELESGELVSPPVRGMAIGRDVRIVYRASRSHSIAGKAFLDLVGREFPETEDGRG
jgi:DNA-binding transcriptional LysR family regulator